MKTVVILNRDSEIIAELKVTAMNADFLATTANTNSKESKILPDTENVQVMEIKIEKNFKDAESYEPYEAAILKIRELPYFTKFDLKNLLAPYGLGAAYVKEDGTLDTLFPVSAVITNIELTPAGPVSIVVAATKQINVKEVLSDDSKVNVNLNNLTIISSDITKATVAKSTAGNFIITAVAAGVCTVSVTYGEYIKTVNVTVTAA